MKKSIRVLYNISFGMVNRLCHIICPFIIRTIILYIMGTLYMGLDGLFVSILGILSLAELGVGSALTYAMYKPLTDGKDEEVCALLQFYKKCYRTIGLIVLGIGLALLPFIKFFIKGDYPSDINIYFLYLIYLSNSVLSYFLYAYKSSLLTAMQRIDIVSNINTLLYMIQNVIQVFLLLATHNYYCYVLVMPVFTVAINLVTERYSSIHYPQYRCVGVIGDLEQRQIATNIKGLLFQRISDALTVSVNNLVVSSFLGLHVLAIYNNYYYIILAIFSLLGIINNAMIPSIGNSCVTQSLEQNFASFQKFNFMYMWIVAWGSAALLCLYQPFMELWVGIKLMLPMYLVALLVTYFFIYQWMAMFSTYLSATGFWWKARYVPLTAAIVNLITNLVLVRIIGLSGVIVSGIITVLLVYDVGYFIVIVHLHFNKKGESIQLVLKQVYYLMITIVICIFTYFIAIYISPHDLLACLIVRTLVCIFVPNIGMMLFYNHLQEYQFSIKFLESIYANIMRRNYNG